MDRFQRLCKSSYIFVSASNLLLSVFLRKKSLLVPSFTDTHLHCLVDIETLLVEAKHLTTTQFKMTLRLIYKSIQMSTLCDIMSEIAYLTFTKKRSVI